MIEAVSAVAFDIGETLVDESRIWCRWADRLGVPSFTLLGLVGAMIVQGRSFYEAFELVRPGIDIEAESAAWAADEPDSLRENFDVADLYPDVPACFEALRDNGLKVVVAGNQPPQAGDALRRMDLEVDGIYTSAQWGVEKPAPEFFDLVVRACGVPREKICYVGDRLDNDVLAAGRSGMRTVLLRRGPWGYLHAAWPEAAEADLVLDDLSGLAAALAA
ncbi:MAG TPA: HAD family hydrolase [Candidatus Limnocylindrales bacterium]|nr:HAD family hydrolase [Candidatus Limnocylindrales bacterium]